VLSHVHAHAVARRHHSKRKAAKKTADAIEFVSGMVVQDYDQRLGHSISVGCGYRSGFGQKMQSILLTNLGQLEHGKKEVCGKTLQIAYRDSDYSALATAMGYSIKPSKKE
jgi:hypothetical protein